MKYAFLLAFAVLCLFPLYWMVTTAVQPMVGIMKTPPDIIPRSVTLGNFRELLDGQPWVSWAGNTVVIVVVATLASVVVSACAGYVFSVHRGPVTEAVFWAFMASLMITRYALMIPVFVVLRKLGLAGQWAVIATGVFSPYGIYLFKVFCDGIPRSFLESARIDGAGEGRVMLSIMLPLTAPAVGALVVAQGVTLLQDYVWQSLVLTQPEQWTLLVGLVRSATGNLARTAYLQNYGAEAAAGVLLFLPLLAVFSVASRYFIKGLGDGGVKA